MDNLNELYQDLILDHGRKPRNFRIVENYNRLARGDNPLCGDKITVTLILDGEVLQDIGFQGSGCAISTASASTMTEALKGKTVSEVKAIFDHFHALATGTSQDLSGLPPKLHAFSGVFTYPMRVKCATLPWHTLNNALAAKEEVASTE
ncbi:MAG: SUF system NifU family Fe-S cluster assembly protein [Polyangiaceae bacterium]|nr:SUF system NifU family Fe-S cluster assembly protein [Polyangiaceae bacterium]